MEQASITAESLAQVIADELRRQAEEDRPDTPYLDDTELDDCLIDGRCNLIELAGAVLRSVQP